MASEDEFESFDDGFGELDWGTIPGLEGPAAGGSNIPIMDASQEDAPPSTLRRSESSESSYYTGDDDIDDAFLLEVDDLERRVVAGNTQTAVPSGSRSVVPRGQASRATASVSAAENNLPAVRMSHLFGANPIPRHRSPPPNRLNEQPQICTPKKSKFEFNDTTRKRARSELSPQQATTNKKGKAKAEVSEEVKQILAGFEDELSCPICCEIFVAAHAGNPCGHSFCGDCGWLWIKKNKKATCAVCRAELDPDMPMLPNIAMQSIAEHHIEVLASNGNDDWNPGGVRLKEWHVRKEKWKTESALRERHKSAARARAGARQRRVAPVFIEIGSEGDNAWLVPDGYDEEDGDYEEAGFEEVRPRTRRGGGRRQR